MQIKIFSILIGGGDSMMEEMNHFLRANKIIDIKKELAMIDGNSCWTFCITYLQDNRPADTFTANSKSGSGTKVDYKEVLDAETFERFSAFRKIRKQIAESEAVPAYAVFTDAELAEIAKLKDLTLTFKPPVFRKSADGQVFLGYWVLPWHCKLSGRSKRRFRSKLLRYNSLLAEEKWTERQYQEHILPLISFAQHAESKKFRTSCLAI